MLSDNVKECLVYHVLLCVWHKHKHLKVQDTLNETTTQKGQGTKKLNLLNNMNQPCLEQ